MTGADRVDAFFGGSLSAFLSGLKKHHEDLKRKWFETLFALLTKAEHESCNVMLDCPNQTCQLYMNIGSIFHDQWARV